MKEELTPKPEGATVGGLWQQLEEMRQKERDERKQQVNLLWAAFDQLVVEKESVWQHGAHTKAAAKWRAPIEVKLHRERLGLDMLLAMDTIRSAAEMFRPMVVKFEGEEGVDERGLKVDAFAHFFSSLFQDEHLGIGSLFEASRGGLVLPRLDDTWAGESGPSEEQARGGEPRPKRQRVGGGSADGGSAAEGLSSERALQLVGRTLAMVLRCGDGYFVADKLPSFVLQLLTTDNCLNTAEQSLEALDEWDPSDGEQARRLLTLSCAELRESLMCDDDDELQLCELMSSLCPEGCQRCKAGSAAGLTCSSCSYLTDENKHDIVIDCINHNLKSTRIRGLHALRDGFTGDDRAADEGKLDGRDQNCYSFFMLQLFRPAEVALRIRGREIAKIEEAWRHFHVTPSEDKPLISMARPSQDDLELVHEWFKGKFLSKKDEEDGIEWMRRLLRFCTGTDRGTGHGEPADRFEDDKDGIKVEVYRDTKTDEPEKVDHPCAATCARTLYLPVAPHEVLDIKFDAALAQFEKEENRSVGGARIEYK